MLLWFGVTLEVLSALAAFNSARLALRPTARVVTGGLEIGDVILEHACESS